MTSSYWRSTVTMTLSGVVSEIQRNISTYSQFSATPLFDTRGGESRQNFLTIFGVENLEWWGYQTVKEVLRWVQPFKHNTGVTDRQTPHDGKDRAIHSVARVTRSSADADNRLDAFSGQSRSTNMVPFHMLHISFLLCNSNIVFKTRRFYDIRLRKFHDLEMGAKGHSRSLRVISFDRLCMVSQCSLVTLSLKCTVFEIFDFKNAVTLKTELRVRQGHWKCHHVIEHL